MENRFTEIDVSKVQAKDQMRSAPVLMKQSSILFPNKSLKMQSSGCLSNTLTWADFAGIGILSANRRPVIRPALASAFPNDARWRRG
jgi:hypothetical protein